MIQNAGQIYTVHDGRNLYPMLDSARSLKRQSNLEKPIFYFFFVKTKIVLFKDLLLGKYIFKKFLIVQKINFFFNLSNLQNNEIT